MSATVLVCGKVFDGASEELTGPAEILVEGNRIASIGRSVNRSSAGHGDLRGFYNPRWGIAVSATADDTGLAAVGVLARTTGVFGRLTRNRASIPDELSRPTTRWPAFTSASVIGTPLPQPTSRIREWAGSVSATAIACATPAVRSRSVAYPSAIRSYSRMLRADDYTQAVRTKDP